MLVRTVTWEGDSECADQEVCLYAHRPGEEIVSALTRRYAGSECSDQEVGGDSPQSVPVEDLHPNVNKPIITLSARTVTKIREQSCSMQNFAVNMVRALYTQEERRHTNVSG